MMYVRNVLVLTLTLAACGSKKDETGGAAGSGAAPVAATKSARIDEAKANEIVKTEVPGFTSKGGRAKKTGMSAVYTATTEPPIDVVVNLGACELCQKMDLELWKKNENLKSMMSSATANDPELVWQVDSIDLGGGKQGIYTYALAYNESDDGKSRGGVNSYNIWFNDGSNQMWMTTSCNVPFTDSTRDEASLEATCPRDKQLAAARQVFGAFAKYF